MPRRVTTKETFKKLTIDSMKNLGTYRPDYDPVIDIYCELREQYALYSAQLKKKSYKCDESTAAGGTKKSALVGTIETLRKDILLYSDRLLLNPKAMTEEKNKTAKTHSPLAKALMELG